MNDTPPFSPFATQPPPAPMFDAAGAAQVPGKKTRKKRAAKVAKPTRKQKTAKVVTLQGAALDKALATPAKRKARKTRPVTISMSSLPSLVGLSADDAVLLMSIIGNMQEAPKKSRTKIVAALAKVFA